MKKLISKYFKIGISILIPFVAVFFVLNWLYGIFSEIVIELLPGSMTYAWWFVFPFVIGLLIAICIIGWIFSFIKPLKWGLNKTEKLIVNNIPVVNKVYNFGKDISDSFITDIKEDGEIPVVEVLFAGQKSLGMLTDKGKNIVFIPTAPNPLNGFLIKTDQYVMTDILFIDFVKMLGSLGRVNGGQWK